MYSVLVYCTWADCWLTYIHTYNILVCWQEIGGMYIWVYMLAHTHTRIHRALILCMKHIIYIYPFVDPPDTYSMVYTYMCNWCMSAVLLLPPAGIQGGLYSPADIHISKIINIYTTSCHAAKWFCNTVPQLQYIYTQCMCTCMYIPAVHPGGR